jgi:hypothetical protein
MKRDQWGKPVPPWWPDETYPRLDVFRGENYVEARPKIYYRIDPDPVEQMRLLHHLAEKNWVDPGHVIQTIIELFAQVGGWQVHPLPRYDQQQPKSST